MADHIYKVEYDDFQGNRTTIKWFKKGVAAFATDYNFTGTGTPLTRRGFCDGRYTTIRGQEVNISFYIKSAADEAELRKLLEGKWYVVIDKVILGGTNTIWYGQVSQFYDEAYTTFPYPVTLTASDGLGLLKEDKILKIDYPTPNSRYSLIEFIAPLINFDDGRTPFTHAPEVVRVDHHLFVDTPGKLLEQVYLDPLVFMDLNDQYGSKWDALNTVLTTLGMKLLQWNAVWYLLAFNIQEEEVGKIEYYEYNLSTLAVGSRTNETLTLDLYADKTNTPVNNDMVLSHSPSWKGVVINKNYVVNTNILPVYANRSGSNYSGHGGTYLEFNAAGALRWWNNGQDAYALKPHKENDGWAKGWGVYRNYANNKYVYADLPHVYFDSFEINLNMISFWKKGLYPAYNYYIFSYLVKLEVGADNYYLYDENATELEVKGEPSYQWSKNSTERLWVHKEMDGQTEMTITVPRPEYNIVNTAKLRFTIYNAFRIVDTSFYKADVFYRNIRVRLLSEFWETQDFSITDEDYRDLYPDNHIDGDEIEISWGGYELGYDNVHEYHLSSPYDSDDYPIASFTSEWFTGGLTLPLALRNMRMTDNARVSRMLSGTVRSFELTPLTLVKDTEGYYYHILDWEYNDRNGYWDIKTIECKNYEAAALAGDYDLTDYNDDYYK